MYVCLDSFAGRQCENFHVVNIDNAKGPPVYASHQACELWLLYFLKFSKIHSKILFLPPMTYFNNRPKPGKPFIQLW